MIHSKIGEAISGAAMQVLNTLKPGLDEKADANAWVIELRKMGRKVNQQQRFDVLYNGGVVDPLVPDLMVDAPVIADPTAAEDFTPTPIVQMIGYLAITNLRLSILPNFKHADLRWKRIVR
jgi:GxxExxY protein